MQKLDMYTAVKHFTIHTAYVDYYQDFLRYITLNVSICSTF